MKQLHHPQSKALIWMTHNDKCKSSSNDLIQRHAIVLYAFNSMQMHGIVMLIR